MKLHTLDQLPHFVKIQSIKYKTSNIKYQIQSKKTSNLGSNKMPYFCILRFRI